MSAFDRRPLGTNICQYASFITLFSSHWTICTITRNKIYCVGVRRFMFEAWLFALAYRARLLETVDFVLPALFSVFAYICMCAEVGGRMPTFDFLCKKVKTLPFYCDKRREKWNFFRVQLFHHYGFVLV